MTANLHSWLRLYRFDAELGRGIAMKTKEVNMKAPNHITSLAIHNLIDCETCIDGKWQPARPMAYASIIKRIKYAWWVFIGKADALTWPKQ